MQGEMRSPNVSYCMHFIRRTIMVCLNYSIGITKFWKVFKNCFGWWQGSICLSAFRMQCYLAVIQSVGVGC